VTASNTARPFEWDEYSDQPKVILDKAFKRRMRAQHWPDLLKVFATAGVVLPSAMIAMELKSLLSPQSPTPRRAPASFFGMGVSLERGDAQYDLVAELGVTEVLVRLPLWKIEDLATYLRFMEGWERRGCNVMVNLLQDPRTIGDTTSIERQARTALSALQGLIGKAQVGNAINRAKWGFYSVSEYLDFFEVFQAARDNYAPSIKLCGPAVIDFEYHHTARALFNTRAIQFDQVSALLYVDRCGHPMNPQLGLFDTTRKIQLLYALASMSPKVENPKLLITEVNWPIKETAPYAPTSETECISEEEYGDYMLAYHQMALATQMVQTIYWHQLIAPGYGLVDNRDGYLRKREAFGRYRRMIQETPKMGTEAIEAA
jgi:hypothetical protein